MDTKTLAKQVKTLQAQRQAHAIGSDLYIALTRKIDALISKAR